MRADGEAMIVSGDRAPAALAALTEKYLQYVANPPPGPVIVVDIQRWSGWSAGA